MKRLTWQFTCVAMLALAGCNQKPSDSKVAQAPEVEVKAASSKGKPSIANKLESYATVRFDEKADSAGLEVFRRTFIKSLAAATDISDTELVSSAFPEVGSESDAFKRDDLGKAKAADLAAMRKAATPLVRLDSSTLKGRISPYDMQTESYTVVMSELIGGAVNFSWSPNEKGGSTYMGYRFEVDGYQPDPKPSAPNEIRIVKKIPKDQARQIEALLAPLRSTSSDSATVAVTVYGTVGKKVLTTAWDRASVTLTPDAYALHLPKQDAALIFIDGPELKTKVAPSSGPAGLPGI